MPKPPGEWTEDDVLALPAGENDSFERKAAASLDLTLPRANQDEVLNELAKQLSAFANAGGGQIIYGVTDAGAVDNGGIPHSIKGRRSTKEWLEDVIPKLVEFELTGFNVYEIAGKSSGSALASGKSLFVYAREALLSVTVFADSAPARKQEFRMVDIDPGQCFRTLLQQEVSRIHVSLQS